MRTVVTSTLYDEADGQWSRPPAFPNGADGLVSTVDDLAAFGTMMLERGAFPGRGADPGPDDVDGP